MSWGFSFLVTGMDKTMLFDTGGSPSVQSANMNSRRLESVISGFQELGMACVGPCHCSGDAARRLFREAYGDEYIDVGVGTVLDV